MKCVAMVSEMSGRDEKPIEIYSSNKEEFKCCKCSGKVVCTNVEYGKTRWWWSYRCLSCGYEGQRMKIRMNIK